MMSLVVKVKSSLSLTKHYAMKIHNMREWRNSYMHS